MSISSKIESLITAANSVTGESRTDLTSAVQDLKDGYGGGGLPAEYEAVEYIESTGTQYIDTGVAPAGFFKIEMVLEMPPVTAQSDLYIFGSTKQSYNLYGVYSIGGYQSKYHAEYGTQTAYFFNSATFTGDTTITYDNGNITITDGITTLTANLSSQSHNYHTRPFFLFGCNNENLAPTVQGLSAFKLKSFKLFMQGVAIADCIPCVRKADGEAGLYDLARKIFLTNQGTGSFVIPT